MPREIKTFNVPVEDKKSKKTKNEKEFEEKVKKDNINYEMKNNNAININKELDNSDKNFSPTSRENIERLRRETTEILRQQIKQKNERNGNDINSQVQFEKVEDFDIKNYKNVQGEIKKRKAKPIIQTEVPDFYIEHEAKKDEKSPILTKQEKVEAKKNNSNALKFELGKNQNQSQEQYIFEEPTDNDFYGFDESKAGNLKLGFVGRGLQNIGILPSNDWIGGQSKHWWVNLTINILTETGIIKGKKKETVFDVIDFDKEISDTKAKLEELNRATSDYASENDLILQTEDVPDTTSSLNSLDNNDIMTNGSLQDLFYDNQSSLESLSTAPNCF